MGGFTLLKVVCPQLIVKTMICIIKLDSMDLSINDSL